MAKVAKTFGTILGAAALIATGVGAVGGLGIIAAATATKIGVIAGIASTAFNMGAQALQKPPPAVGSVAQSIISPTALQPYCMGTGYVGGVLRHDVGFGATLDGVVNPYRFQAWVYSGGGPVQSISPRVDFGTVGSYYTGFLTTDTQTGATPEADALTSSFGTPPGWGSAYKLSGQAAIGWSFKFDKRGKVFASGLPVLGAYGQWTKVYDPRLDSTFPGGSGSCRLGDESTYVWSENPALHAGTYAYGRYQNGKRVFGIGMPAEGIDWPTVAAWANVCDANDWTIFGRIFEPGDRGQNLSDICAAGGAQPIFAGAVLSFHYSAPSVALDTITDADIADEACSITAQQSYRNRLNTIIPKYTSETNNWEQVAAEPVVVPTYLTDDGEERAEEWPFNLVRDVTQAAQLATYKLVDGREFYPITLVCHPRMRGYRPGDCLHLELSFGEDELVLDTDAIILTREIDPATMKVTFTLIGETPGKHAYALGETGTPPATPTLGQTGEDADQIAGVSTSGVGVLLFAVQDDFDNGGTVGDGFLAEDEPIGSVPSGGKWRLSAGHETPLGGGSTGFGNYTVNVTLDGTGTPITFTRRVRVNNAGEIIQDTLVGSQVKENTLSGDITVTVEWVYTRSGVGADIDLAIDDVNLSLEYISE